MSSRTYFLSSALVFAVSLTPACVLDSKLGSNSQESTGTGGAAGSAGSSGAAGAAGSGTGGAAGTGATAGTGGTAGTGATAGTGGTGGVPAPNPPAGYVKCGSGTFGQTEAKTSCESVFEVPGFGVLHDPKDEFPSACDRMTLATGRYDIWCSNAKEQDYYLWAELTGVAQAPGCTSEVPQLTLAHIYYDAHHGWSGGNGPHVWQPDYDGKVYVETTESYAGHSGKGKIWISGNLWNPGPFQSCHEPEEQHKTLTGFNFAWFGS